MAKIITAIALAAFAATTATVAIGSDKSDVVALLHKLVDDYNKGDKSWTKVCADQIAMLDNLPPYYWHGEGACTKWAADNDAAAKTYEVTEQTVFLGKIRLIEITADSAYVIAAASSTYKVKGKPMKETGAWTIALQKGASGWRINALTYTLSKIEPVSEAAPAK
jgi:hypothetical protein